MPTRIYTAPRGSSKPVLGCTLPSLLEEACRNNPTPRALNQMVGEEWVSWSSEEFRQAAGETALGLLDIGLARQDRVCLFMHSDADFGIVDMGCLVAGVIDVPIYLTHAPDSILFVLRHAQARALVVSDEALLAKVAPFLDQLSFTKIVIVARPEGGEEAVIAPPGIPEDVEISTLDQLRRKGRKRLERHPEATSKLLSEIDSRDIATIIYTSGTTGEPKGVMLTHQNLTFNCQAAFQAAQNVEKGKEVILSFLPLTHVFSRMLHYGYLHYGAAVYFTEPERFSEHLKSVRPTAFAAVPHVLEKTYDKIVLRGLQLKGLKKRTFDWALQLARSYDMTRRRGPLHWSRMRLADKLVYSRWRQALGGRLKGVICGGAPLQARLVNFFAAAGIHILQGYGQTETSPVVTFNRLRSNRPGTVGVPLPGVEVRLADDGEILTRGPHLMHGYYRNPQATRETIDPEGWLSTGDIGEINRKGYLKITDRKKSLFKLSTGKFVIPQPLESRLTAEPLVDQAVACGPGRKYCTVLICPGQDALRAFARLNKLDDQAPIEELLQEKAVLERFQRMVDQASRGMPHWSQIQYFTLLPVEMTPENGLLTPTLKVRRSKVYERFQKEIDAMSAHEDPAEAALA
ncbi:MAG: long-chain fatty acid--CoA ligase [Acidobacteriota bacterium]